MKYKQIELFIQQDQSRNTSSTDSMTFSVQTVPNTCPSPNTAAVPNPPVMIPSNQVLSTSISVPREEVTELTSDSICSLMDEKFSLTKEELVRLSRKSCSEGNFAVKLMPRIFSKEEVVGRNCNGKRGKQKLDPF